MSSSPPPQEPRPDLRLRRRARIKAQLQDEALALIVERGYEGTSVDDIAHAAAISPRTFYRYFACKEDVVLWDETDDLPAAELWGPRTGDDAIALMVGRMRELTARLYRADRDRLLLRATLCYTVPDIRARFVNQQVEMLATYWRALAEAFGMPLDDLRLLAPAAAVFTAMLVAVEQWQRHDGVDDLLDLIDEAIASLAILGQPPSPGLAGR